MMKKRGCALWLAAMLLLVVILIPVHGHEIPDTTRAGSIRIAMKDGKDALPGGTLTLYRVGEIAESNGDYFFVLAPAVKDSEVSLKDIQSAETAKKLAAWIDKHPTQHTQVQIDKDGKAAFSDLVTGLYLVVQTEAAEGYLCADPFLVSLPMHDGSGYVYDVEATPKVEVEKEPETEETTTTKPPQIPGKLPQTGQNNWPIPVLCCGGLILILVGVILCCGRKKTGRSN